jgi:hypothetical protein
MLQLEGDTIVDHGMYYTFLLSMHILMVLLVLPIHLRRCIGRRLISGNASSAIQREQSYHLYSMSTLAASGKRTF